MAFLYMPDRQAALLFGGQGQSGYLNDTWSWKSGCWTKLSPADTPPVLTNLAAAYDISRHVAVVFGQDFTTTGWVAETWTWNGQDWQKAVTGGPKGYVAAAAYDSNGMRIVLLDMWSGGTWTWNGVGWDRLPPSAEPAGRYFPSMTFDPSTKTVLLFGGNAPFGGGHLNDTWSWNGTTWAQLHPITSPPPRAQAALVSHSGTGRVLLVGGENGVLLSDAWSWDGSSWTPIPSLGVRAGAAAIDIGSAVLVFGGWTGPYSASNDVSAWDGKSWVAA